MSFKSEDIQSEVAAVVGKWAGDGDLIVIAVFSRASGGVEYAEFHHSSVLEAEVRYKALRDQQTAMRGVVLDVVRGYPVPKTEE